MIQLGSLTEELTTTLDLPTSTTTTSTRNIELVTTLSTTPSTTQKSTLGRGAMSQSNKAEGWLKTFKDKFLTYFLPLPIHCILSSGIFFGRKSTTKLVEMSTLKTTLETPAEQLGLLDGMLRLNNVILKEGGKVIRGFMDLLGR